jgi:hypothetical protein
VPCRRALARVVQSFVVLSFVLAGCVAHPVGPARSVESYERKANTTAESALSAVETVLLLAATGTDGNAFGSYLSIAVSEQEDALGGLRGTFLSIQPPPGVQPAAVRDELSTLLTDAFNHVGDVRIQVRRGHLDDLDAVAEPLQLDAEQLRALMDELS